MGFRLRTSEGLAHGHLRGRRFRPDLHLGRARLLPRRGPRSQRPLGTEGQKGAPVLVPPPARMEPKSSEQSGAIKQQRVATSGRQRRPPRPGARWREQDDDFLN